MNNFMRWLLNVPDGNLVNVLRMDDMNNGKNDSKRLFDKIRYIFDVDIENLVGDSIYKTHGSKDPKKYSLTDYFRTLVRKFDDIMGAPTDPLKKNAADVEKQLEYKYTNEASVDGRVEYLLCNLYQMIMSVNYTECHGFMELSEIFPSLVYTDSEELERIKAENKKNNESGKKEKFVPVSIDSLRKHLKANYEGNILSYLFRPEESAEEKYNESGNMIGHKNRNFCFTEATEEIQIATVFTGTKNVYNDKYRENFKYSFANLRTFSRKYNSVLKKVNSLQSKQGFDGEIKVELDKESLHCSKYISDMIYAFNLTSFMSCYVTGKEFDNVFSENMFLESSVLLMQIPDIRRRRDYLSLIMYAFANGDIFKERTLSKEIHENILYEARMYYPLLTLAAIECIRRLALTENTDKNTARYFLGNLPEAFKEMKLSDFKSFYPVNEKNYNAPIVPKFYSKAAEEIFDRSGYTKLGLKITTHDFKPQDMMRCILQLEDEAAERYERAEKMDDYDEDEEDEEDDDYTICKHKLRASDLTDCLDCVFLKSYMNRKNNDIS